MSANDKKYLHLKQALKELNYAFELKPDTETVALVEALFSDLINVTRKYQSVKTEYEASEGQRKEQNSIILPLKDQNTELIRRNEELTQELNKRIGNFEKEKSEMSEELQKWQTANKNLEFLLIQQKNLGKTKTQQLEKFGNKYKVIQKTKQNKSLLETKDWGQKEEEEEEEKEIEDGDDDNSGGNDNDINDNNDIGNNYIRHKKN
ncbi:hypothetical protein RFI_20864 [Reticulomyxa filosa]|uniref:Uncharacterized protein n=1 Tax=Reticulomyxa filosa TaxID=46433 RepID=X6MSR0_RETFI|nr:hypothetical protein RFI_20864 [Reticulomyxa filosa]|eukprot:ETO16477.1 hypothetical protein RFI_20864 [Reticulomyxa filosa]